MLTDPLSVAETILKQRDSHDPSEVLAVVEAASERVETPCGDGSMVWRVFGDGPPLVLLHGGHGSWLHWILPIPTLARHRRLLVADLPGFGESAALPDGTPTRGGEAAAAVAAPVKAGVDIITGTDAPVAVAGFSFGGVISTYLAAALGERCERLFLLGAPGWGLPVMERPPLRRVRDVTSADELAEVHRANLAAMMLADPANIDALAVKMQTLNVPRARTPSRPVSRTEALISTLPKVSAPVTAIYGDLDVVAPQHAEREALLKGVHPEAEQYVIAEAGHWVMYEAADRVAEIILEILSRSST
ncbi:alpha/beta fold hydrolase [Acuticoccus mangrovi]|uniref:Alpha/beta hydrolase n=1 Tax=Acuticoccus mangrovi TaxID=2796142 RepID=A0A934MG46_9HYPH|nr:alpha/beta hydrolase [Acuticoccus mangrovi]MBJ3774566.1 alpha/beta hydrolase [Acuticoccus mangrovi]